MAARVLGVRTDPFHKNYSSLVSNLCFESVTIASHVEDHNVVCEKACGRVPSLDVPRRSPHAAFYVVNPVADPLSTVGVPLSERQQHFLSEYFHAQRPRSWRGLREYVPVPGLNEVFHNWERQSKAF